MLGLSQGNSLCNYLYLKQKCHVFLFLFSLFSFLFYKIGQQQGRTAPAQRGGLAPVGGGRWRGNWIGIKKYVHMYINAKMIPVESIPGIRVGGIKERGVNSSMI
jgi:hypothetical protein